MNNKVRLVLEPQPEGGFTVTSPVVNGLVTEGDSVEECLVHAQDALAALIEVHDELKSLMPKQISNLNMPVEFDYQIKDAHQRS